MLFSRISFTYPVAGVVGYCCTWSHAMRHTFYRNSLDEWSALRRGLLPTQDINRVGFFCVFFTLFCTSFYSFFCLDCPAFCLFSLLTTHNANIHALGGIRTPNSSKQSSADPRLKPLANWDRLIKETHSIGLWIRTRDPSSRVAALGRTATVLRKTIYGS